VFSPRKNKLKRVPAAKEEVKKVIEEGERNRRKTGKPKNDHFFPLFFSFSPPHLPPFISDVLASEEAG